MSYFKHYPTTQFDGYELADITRKFKLDDVTQDTAVDYMTYTVKEGETPEDIAFYYYDSVDLTWLVLMANDIIDPYTQWPKSENNLERFIVAKYKEKSGKSNYQDVLDWTRNMTITSNIIDYKSQFDSEVRLNRTSFVSLGNSHTVTVKNIIKGNEYTIHTLGTVSNDDWELLTGVRNSDNFVVGYKFIAKADGADILFGDTARVTGSSLTNPAREFIPVRAYDYEWELNEERREIELINKGYVAALQERLETILKDG